MDELKVERQEQTFPKYIYVLFIFFLLIIIFIFYYIYSYISNDQTQENQTTENSAFSNLVNNSSNQILEGNLIRGSFMDIDGRMALIAVDGKERIVLVLNEKIPIYFVNQNGEIIRDGSLDDLKKLSIGTSIGFSLVPNSYVSRSNIKFQSELLVNVPLYTDKFIEAFYIFN